MKINFSEVEEIKFKLERAGSLLLALEKGIFESVEDTEEFRGGYSFVLDMVNDITSELGTLMKKMI